MYMFGPLRWAWNQPQDSVFWKPALGASGLCLCIQNAEMNLEKDPLQKCVWAPEARVVPRVTSAPLCREKRQRGKRASTGVLTLNGSLRGWFEDVAPYSTESLFILQKRLWQSRSKEDLISSGTQLFQRTRCPHIFLQHCFTDPWKACIADLPNSNNHYHLLSPDMQGLGLPG